MSILYYIKQLTLRLLIKTDVDMFEEILLSLFAHFSTYIQELYKFDKSSSLNAFFNLITFNLRVCFIKFFIILLN